MNAHIDECNDLLVDGQKYHLSPAQATLMRLLLPGRVVSLGVMEDALWPIDADYDALNGPQTTIRAHLHRLRQKQPLTIRWVSGCGYILEPLMTEEKPRPPEVDQALGRVKADFEEGALRDLDLKPGPREYSGDTGKIKASNDKIDVEVIVRPKESK